MRSTTDMDRKMQGPLFARPSLKCIVIGALLVAVVNHFAINGRSEPPALRATIADPGYEASDAELRQMAAYAAERCSAETFRRVSQCYEQRKDFRKAIAFLRAAEQADE